MSELLVVMVTFPSEDVVRQIGTILLEKQLIACINCVPSVTSIYQWQGKVCEEKEVLGMLKTTKEKYSALEATLLELHPYEVPEIVGLPVEQLSNGYLKWVIDSL